MAERVTRKLSDRLGENCVAAHHGSLAKEQQARRRAASQERRAEGDGGDGLARARHRHRRGRSRMPARLAAFDRELPAARRALRARGRRHAQGSLVPAVARRSRRMRRPARQRPIAASSIVWRCRRNRSTCWLSRSLPRSARGNGSEDELFLAGAARVAISKAFTRDNSPPSLRMLGEGFSTRRGRRGA